MNLEKLFIKLLSRPSVTPDDGGILDFLCEYLHEFTAIKINVGGVKNLFLYKVFDPNHSLHLSFAGHVDVVPGGDNWDSDPFIPIKKDGYIYARGTQDMKSGVAAAAYALKNVKYFPGTLSLMLTSDEEGEGTHGIIEVLRYLQKNNLLPDFCLVAEPTCDEVFGDNIKIGRRGSINSTLIIKGEAGHAAYPQKCVNPVNLLGEKLGLLAGHLFDKGDEFFAPSQLVITDIRGGNELTNVTPSQLKIMFNVRNSLQTSKEDIQKYISQIFHDLKYDLQIKVGSKPFLTNKNSLLITLLSQAVKNITSINPRFTTSGGTSDARHMGEFGIEVAEFGVINDRIHAKNERVKLSEVEDLVRIFSHLLKWEKK